MYLSAKFGCSAPDQAAARRQTGRRSMIHPISVLYAQENLSL